MDVIILVSIIIAALVLFITEIIRVDLVALLIMSALIVTGLLSPAEAVAGFSNAATVTVLFMFILSAALLKTGALSRIGAFFAEVLNRNFTLGLATMMLSIAFVSAFINNTPVVALFIPVLLQTAKEAKLSPSKLLMPLSFASIFGGMCTLIGTSTNVLVDGIARQNGLEGFEMFTLAPAGICLLIGGMLYMLTIGHRLLPTTHSQDEQSYHLREYLTEVRVSERSASANKHIKDAPLVKDHAADILAVLRGNEVYSLPAGDFLIKAGDVLKVRSNLERLQRIKEESHAGEQRPLSQANDKIGSRDTSLVELIITSNSRFEGKTLQEVNFRQRYRAIPLAIRHREDIIHDRLMDSVLKSGDIVLVEIKNNRLIKLKEEEFQQNQPFILLTERAQQLINWTNLAIVLSCLLGVIVLSSLDILHVLGGTLIASVILILTGCLPVKEIYDVVDWKVIILLAGALSLGVAMERTGLSASVATFVINTAGPWGPIAIVSGLYLITSLLTEIMSNNASAALLAPIAISTAAQLEASPMPFLIAITLGASASFITPVGYQTNTMIYGAGGYRFKDFSRVGIGLNLLFWIIASLVIPFFYSLY